MNKYVLLVALGAVMLTVFAHSGEAKSAMKKRSVKNPGAAKIDMAAVKASINKVKAARSKRATASEVKVAPSKEAIRNKRSANSESLAAMAEKVKRNVLNMQNVDNMLNTRAKRSAPDASVRKQRAVKQLKNRRARATANQDAKFNKKIVSKLAKVKKQIVNRKK